MAYDVDEIVSYKTPDRKIFEYHDKAIRHIENNVGPLLERVFKDYANANPAFNASKLALHLMETDKLADLKKILDKWIV